MSLDENGHVYGVKNCWIFLAFFFQKNFSGSRIKFQLTQGHYRRVDWKSLTHYFGKNTFKYNYV